MRRFILSLLIALYATVALGQTVKKLNAPPGLVALKVAAGEDIDVSW